MLTLTQKPHFVIVAQPGRLLRVEADEALAATGLEQQVLDEGRGGGVEGVVGSGHPALGTHHHLIRATYLLEFLGYREKGEKTFERAG